MNRQSISHDLAPIKVDHKALLFANLCRAAVGLVCFGVALLWLPLHTVTPIMCGVAMLMMTQASYNAWKVGAQERRLMAFVKICIGLTAGLSVGLLVLALYAGFGAFSGGAWTE